MLFAVKGILVEFLLAGLSQVLLLLPLVRRIFLLDLPRSGRYNGRIVAAMVGFGLLFTMIITVSQDYIIDQRSPWERIFIFGDRMQLTVIMSTMLFALMGGVSAFFFQRFLASQEDLLDRKKELKKAIQKISLLNRNLERRVSQRTAQLQRANRELQNFVSTVSHDLKSPLRAIYSCCEMIREDAGNGLFSSSGCLEMTDEIEKTSGEMIGLIERLLEYAIIEEAEVKRSSFDPGALIKELSEELRRTNPEIPIQVRIDHSPVRIESDPYLFKDIFRNLLSNAVKFSRPRGRADISVDIQQDPQSYTFYIHDQGVGFPSAESEKLFQIFERFHRKKDFEGHGVGLAAVKKMVDKLGGEISITSEENQGTLVTVRLPGMADTYYHK